MVRHGSIVEEIFTELNLNKPSDTEPTKLLELEDFDIQMSGIAMPSKSFIYIDKLATITLKVLSKRSVI